MSGNRIWSRHFYRGVCKVCVPRTCAVAIRSVSSHLAVVMWRSAKQARAGAFLRAESARLAPHRRVSFVQSRCDRRKSARSARRSVRSGLTLKRQGGILNSKGGVMYGPNIFFEFVSVLLHIEICRETSGIMGYGRKLFTEMLPCNEMFCNYYR